MPRRLSPFGAYASFFCLAMSPIAAGCDRGESQPPSTTPPQTAAPATTVQSPIRTMAKRTTEQASFVLYLPADWTASESTDAGCRILTVDDPATGVRAVVRYGRVGAARSAADLARRLIEEINLRSQNHDLTITDAWTADDGRRLSFAATYRRAEGARQLRAWIATRGTEYLESRIDAPASGFTAVKPLLLTVLSNLRVTTGAFAWSGAEPEQVELASHRLRDGSASFLLPRDWKLDELGHGQFVATDPSQQFSFLASSIDFITPRMGVRPPNTPVSPYLPPHRALKLVAESQGLARDLQWVDVNHYADLAREMGRVYTLGQVEVDDCTYTCTGRYGRSKGYSLGVSFGSRLDTNWNYRHLTVGAPIDRFDAWLPTFAAMLESYEVDEAWAANYVARGAARLGRLQQQTMQLVSRNAEAIRHTMQAAYDERQRSQDYIDYQRSNYIRGQQDWISALEGGTVYHSDAWGTVNTETGEEWRGKAFDYVHFEGDNPKYGERMQPVDTRELWERRVVPRQG